LKKAESDLKDLKEKHCHPEPNCWEQANAHYEETAAVCEALEDENEKEHCYDKAMTELNQWIDQCGLEECYDEVHAYHQPMFEECDAIWNDIERTECREEVEKALKEAL
jgi:hypothetical protein